VQSNVSMRIEEPATAASITRRPPELALMAAVLQDAIRSFCECSGSRGVRSRKLFAETSQWFASRDHDWPFAFESICAALGIEPDWIRRLLRGWLDGTGSKQDRPAAVPRLHLASRRRPLASVASRPKSPDRVRGLHEVHVP
jgi:hypothetical protein